MKPSASDRIKGAFYGYAIGDALGLGTEFMTRREVERHYPGRLTDFSQFIRDAHRSLSNPGEWSATTTTVLITADSILRSNAIIPEDIARELQAYFTRKPHGISPDLRCIFNQPTYSSDPFGTAERVWKEMGNNNCPNDPVGNAIVAGMWSRGFSESAEKLCRLTHPQQRCVACCMAVAMMVHSILWHDETASYSKIVKTVLSYNGEDSVPYVEMSNSEPIEALDLDNEEDYWYVRKTMASALWPVWHDVSLEEGLYALVNEGGDSAVNASVGTAMLGLKYGVRAIPKHLLESISHREYLDDVASRFAESVISR